MLEEYDSIGKTYNATRKADSRISKAILDCLEIDQKGIVADIGVDFNLPYDLKDGFFFTGWRKPELYLNKEYCTGILSLAKW